MSILSEVNRSYETLFLRNGLRLGPFSELQDVEFERSLALDKFSCAKRTSFGRCVGLGSFSFISDAVVGSYVSIASRVSIGAFNHPTSWLTVNEIAYRPENWGVHARTRLQAPERMITMVGNDVWIGDNSFVKSGVKVHDGTIIAAGSVLTKEFSPYSVIGGNPAKVIRYRFDAKKIESILASEWWLLEPEEIVTLDFKDIDSALEQIEDIKRLRRR
jgi:acetyltransferase-like isoleucine patch superfamily enzyme